MLNSILRWFKKTPPAETKVDSYDAVVDAICASLRDESEAYRWKSEKL